MCAARNTTTRSLTRARPLRRELLCHGLRGDDTTARAGGPSGGSATVELLAWGGSAPPPSVPVRSTFKTLFKQQQLVQKREEERAEAAALESKATKRLANMASIAASKSMRSMPGLAR